MQEGACALILTAMQNHLFNANVQRIACLALLAFIDRNREHKKYLLNEGEGLNVGTVLLTSLDQHPLDDVLQEYGCKLISRLFHEVGNHLKTQFLKATVVAMDNHVEDERIQEIGCRILGATKSFSTNVGVYDLVEEALITAKSVHPNDERILSLVARFLN